MASDFNRGLRLVPVGSTWAFELEASIIRDIDLLVAMIYQEDVRAECEAPEVRGGAELVEICGSQPGVLRTLNYAARVDAIDASAIVQMQGEGRLVRRSERDVALALPAGCCLY